MEEKECLVLEHIKKLLKDNVVPPLEGELAELPLLQDIHNDLKAIREITYAFSMGDLSPSIKVRGIIPGCLKTLQAHLRHMIWQVQMVEQGDFAQQVQFLGEFSTAFNSMVRQFDATLKALKQKEEALTALADSLRDEVTSRDSTVEALRESESQFKYLANHDHLTGALNRRSFMDRAIIELAASINHNTPCSLAMMDIDHFKRFNDTYGHLAGDEVLRHVVEVISSLLRKNDFLGRYGGEEFIFYFSHVDKSTSIAIAERVREAIATTPVKLKSGPVFITASFGIAIFQDGENPEEKNDLETCIHYADIALYQAKKGGRNKVVCFSKEMAEE
ncbi:MAG: diguanylate cyclase [Spirochaetaceae bacterium]|jgi:diguanylate cyclase (GGDEF)-like protein|nr:diguanylate cyclase [Spirochaetaceae bacterium]